MWLEITNLLIPGVNDSGAEIDALTRRVAGQLGPDVPVHFTAFLAGLVSAHRDDAPRAELSGRQYGEQADSTVTDNSDGLPRAGLGGDGAEPAGAEHVAGGEQARDQVARRDIRDGDESAVAQGTRRYSAWAPFAPMSSRWMQEL